MERSDEEIMRLHQSGDSEGMSHIFQRYKIRILNFCFGLLGNRADAEEAAADVFLALVANRNSYDSNRTFSTWIYTIARNKCVNRIRKRKNIISLWISSEDGSDGEMLDIPDSNDHSRDSLIKKEISLNVRRAIAKLPHEQKEAVILRQYHGFSYQQISEILSCSLEKVKILIFRAKEQLRVVLVSFVKEEQL